MSLEYSDECVVLDHNSSICALQFMAANSAMQGAYLPQYAHMQTASLPVEVSGGNVVLAYHWEYFASMPLGSLC